MRRSALPSVWPYPRSKGSMITFAWVGERFWTSMIRGFRKVVALLCIRRYLCQMAVEERSPSSALLRIKFDHQLFVHVVGEFRAVREALESALEALGIDLDPAGESVLLGEVERGLDAKLPLRLLTHGHHVGGAHQVRRNIDRLGVHLDRLVRHELAGLRARGGESHPVDDVVQAAFEHLQQVLAGG